MRQRDFTFIGTGSGWGATNMGTGKGPQHLLNSIDPEGSSSQKFSTLSSQSIILQNFHHFETLIPFFPLTNKEKIFRHHQGMQALRHHFAAIQEVMGKDLIPFSIGGDHSVAIATWSAVKQHYPEFGLIWIDAHLDAHTPQTTPSEALHGMPVAALLGYGDKDVKDFGHIGAKILPHNLVYIGVRSFEPEEEIFLTNLGVKIYSMTAVKQRGFAAVFNEAKASITKTTPFYGISLDIDAFDPAEAPGTGAKVAGGMTEADVFPSLTNLLNDKNLICFEIVEFNPDLDEGNKTLSFLWRLTKTILSPSYSQNR